MLDGCGWTDGHVLAGIANIGMADSFHKARQITRTRHTHQVSAAALFILQKHVYDGPATILDFDAWCLHQHQTISKFKYWSLTLKFLFTIVIFVRSLRTSDFGLYIDSHSSHLGY